MKRPLIEIDRKQRSSRRYNGALRVNEINEKGESAITAHNARRGAGYLA